MDSMRRITHSENEELLCRLRDRKTRLGISATKIEVRFEDLCVEADVLYGGRALPTLLNTTINFTQEVLGLLASRKKPLKILDRLSGIIRPSRMTLVLGPPGSGKSTFLRALARKLDSSLRVKGSVTYNGQDMSHFIPQRTCAYVSQFDFHHAEMTVRETLDFARRMLDAGETTETMVTGANPDVEADPEIDAFVKVTKDNGGRNFVTEYVIEILGLSECSDIMIGDAMRRGISGGQKKRVTVGEMLVGLARTYFMDDISTGLDSSTTYEIIKFLSQMVHLMDFTVVISLLQPQPETFELFDDIILLCEGQIVFQGPRETALEFFASMGFSCPERKSTADFLQEVISKMDQEQYWSDKQNIYQYIPVEKFVKSFHSYPLGMFIKEELQQPYSQPKNDSSTLSQEMYQLPKWKLLKACFSREVLLIKRNSPTHIFKIVQISFLALVVMTVFLRINMKHSSITDGNKYMGVIFCGVVIVKFNGMTELTMTVLRLPIFYRQRELLFLPGWALLLSIFLLSIPMSLIESGIWTTLTYFTVGFAPSVTRFFQQLLALFLVHQMSMGLFRLIAIIGRTQVVSNMLSTAALVALYILGGFVISRDNLKSWWAWAYWVSPLTYAQNAVAINEFLDDRWNMPIQDNSVDEDTIGKAILRSRGMFTEWHWYWISVGALLGFSLLFNVLSILGLEYFNPLSISAPKKHQTFLPAPANQKKKTKKNINANMDEKDVKTPKNGMVLPFQPITLAFSHISYFVDMPTEMRNHGFHGKRLQLLKDVSGAFQPGVLTALMGVTGAGKTTLLDVLAGRKTGGYTEGRITISGYPKQQETFARISGYCEQNDIHSPFVTVNESLQYSAWLRLPSEIKCQTKKAFVEEVLGLVELKPLKNAMVGLPGVSGLSTEQRKRLTIAVELVSSPSIIFMDEPTTGLDARAAAIVMRTVRNTVDTGRTVVCTIHQPSIEIFEAFDELLLMKRGGQLIYGGPLGHLSQNMIQYFEGIPGVPKIKDGQNPAAWMLDVSSPAMEFQLDIDFAQIFSQSSLYVKNKELVNELSKPKSHLEDLHFPSKYTQSFRTQCIACLWKQNQSYWKDPEHNVFRFANTVVASFLFGTIFWDIGSNINKAQDLFNILGAIYGSALFLGFPITCTVQPIVGLERTVFYRETSARMYSSMPYAIAQVAIEIPYIIIQVVIYTFSVYWMIGFPWEVAKFLWFLSFIFLNFVYFALFGMMTVSFTPNQEIAAALSFLIFVMWNLFSGFFIARPMIPKWWRWFYWADPAAWTVYGLMISQLGDRTDLIHVPGLPDQTVKEFLNSYMGLSSNHLGLMLSLHFVIIFVFLFVYGISIKHLNFQRR
ncbi:ABC transporter G family member 45-like [Aristolochia californica]|uniref:ABC transporter G family member 45-like n=1 Tax=Aristolochia californica TaxID=171875 RepID=UPI0035E00C0B